MVFSSVLFLLYFLPAFLLAYSLAPKKLKNPVILLASIIFYSWGAPKFVFILLGSTYLDFFIVRSLFRSKSQRHRKYLLTASIVLNVGLLAYFKYANFFVENVNDLLSLAGINTISWVNVALPIGISFYTFQTLTYSIDVYRKVHDPLKRASDYMLYIMSFPQLIAGPIVRFNSIADQIEDRRDLVEDKLSGFYRFCIGLAKKVLIANVMAEQADAIFNSNYQDLNYLQAWTGVLAYTLQIYFDFAGYSDMAIGLGRMMGFRFPENFNSPYISKNISEFWRRWHITLGAFMRDYLYIPLGGNRVSSKARVYFNLWVVFLISGLWHGASWNFVIWGAFHGVFLILDRVFLIRLLNKLGKPVSVVFTLFVVMIGWVIFRIEDFELIFMFMGRLLDISMGASALTTPGFISTAIIGLIFSFITAFPVGKRLHRFFFEKHIYQSWQHFILMVMSLLLFIISIIFITGSSFNLFIYFRF